MRSSWIVNCVLCVPVSWAEPESAKFLMGPAFPTKPRLHPSTTAFYINKGCHEVTAVAMNPKYNLTLTDPYQPQCST